MIQNKELYNYIINSIKEIRNDMEILKNRFNQIKNALILAKTGEEYLVKDIVSEDEELKAFLFSLGCYSGEPITVISHIKGGCVVSIKDARYNMDTDLAKAISI